MGGDPRFLAVRSRTAQSRRKVDRVSFRSACRHASAERRMGTRRIRQSGIDAVSMSSFGVIRTIPCWKHSIMPAHRRVVRGATRLPPRPQALALLNNSLSREWAEAFAGRVIQQAGAAAERQVDTAYRLAYSRDLSRQRKTLPPRSCTGKPRSSKKG